MTGRHVTSDLNVVNCCNQCPLQRQDQSHAWGLVNPHIRGQWLKSKERRAKGRLYLIYTIPRATRETRP